MIWLVENTHGFFIAFFCLTTAFPSSLVVSPQPCQQSPTQCHSKRRHLRRPRESPTVSTEEAQMKDPNFEVCKLLCPAWNIKVWQKKKKTKQCLASEDTVSHLRMTLVNLLRSVQPHPLSVTSLRLWVLVSFCLLICLSSDLVGCRRKTLMTFASFLFLGAFSSLQIKNH